MPADKLLFQSEIFYSPCDVSLYAAHICQQAVGRKNRFQFPQVGKVDCHRAAEKEEIAGGKIFQGKKSIVFNQPVGVGLPQSFLSGSGGDQ